MSDFELQDRLYWKEQVHGGCYWSALRFALDNEFGDVETVLARAVSYAQCDQNLSAVKCVRNSGIRSEEVTSELRLLASFISCSPERRVLKDIDPDTLAQYGVMSPLLEFLEKPVGQGDSPSAHSIYRQYIDSMRLRDIENATASVHKLLSEHPDSHLGVLCRSSYHYHAQQLIEYEIDCETFNGLAPTCGVFLTRHLLHLVTTRNGVRLEARCMTVIEDAPEAIVPTVLACIAPLIRFRFRQLLRIIRRHFRARAAIRRFVREFS